MDNTYPTGLRQVTSQDQLKKWMYLQLHGHAHVSSFERDETVLHVQVVVLTDERVVLETFEPSGYHACQFEETIDEFLDPDKFGFRVFTNA